MDLGDGVLGSALRAEAIRAWLEVRLEDRLEHQLQRGLHDPVGGRRDPQAADLARRLGDRLLPHPLGNEPAGLEIISQPAEQLPAPNTIERGATPSTPAVRAPLLPRTRLHATTRNAGSYTRLARSSKRRPGSAVAHWCSFVCIASTRSSASIEARATARRCSPATSSISVDAANTLDPFAMWPAFPTSDYYGSSAPPRRHRPATGLPADQLAAGRGGDRRDGSHVHSRTVRRGRRPAMPLQHRHGYAAGLHRGLPAGDITQPRSSPHHAVRVRAATQPRSARFELVGLLRSVQPLVPHVHLSVLLAGPGPSGSAGPSRRCQGCFPPSPSSQGSGCPQLQRARCDGPAAVSFHHRTVRERLVALHLLDPQDHRSLEHITLHPQLSILPLELLEPSESARRRVRHGWGARGRPRTSARDRRRVFLAAARGGDFEGLLSLLSPT